MERASRAWRIRTSIIYREVQPIHEIVNEPGRFEGRVDFSEPPNGVNVGCWLGSKPDAEAIAAAPEGVRWLVAEVERLREENEQMYRDFRELAEIEGLLDD